MKYKIFSAPFLTISSNLALLQLPNKIFTWYYEGSTPHIKMVPSLLQSKSEKYEHWILNWILHIRNSLCIKFHFEQIILNFWTKFTQERYLCSKTEKVTSSLNSAYSPNFSLNWQFWFFFIRFIQKGFFWSKTEKVNTAYFLHNYST